MRTVRGVSTRSRAPGQRRARSGLPSSACPGSDPTPCSGSGTPSAAGCPASCRPGCWPTRPGAPGSGGTWPAPWSSCCPWSSSASSSSRCRWPTGCRRPPAACCSALLFSIAFMTETIEHRVTKAGYPPGTAAPGARRTGGARPRGAPLPLPPGRRRQLRLSRQSRRGSRSSRRPGSRRPRRRRPGRGSPGSGTTRCCGRSATPWRSALRIASSTLDRAAAHDLAQPVHVVAHGCLLDVRRAVAPTLARLARGGAGYVRSSGAPRIRRPTDSARRAVSRSLRVVPGRPRRSPR